MRSKGTEFINYFSVEEGNLPTFTEFDYLYLYDDKFKCIDARFVNFNSYPEKVRYNVELFVYKLRHLNPQITFEKSESVTIDRLRNYYSETVQFNITESDVRSIHSKAWQDPNYDMWSRDIYSYKRVIWKSGFDYVFLPSDKTVSDIERSLREKKDWLSTGKDIVLSPEQRQKIKTKTIRKMTRENKNKYYNECRSKKSSNDKYTKILNAIEQLIEDDEFVSVSKIANITGLGVETTRFHINKIKELTELVKNHNIGSFGVENGHEMRRKRNVDSIIEYVNETGDISKSSISRELGISRRTVYNLWDEVEQHLSK